MTKAVTCTAAMQLVEQGRLKLDEPVPSIDPALSAPQVLDGFDAAGAPKLRPAKRPITLRHLMTHTAGFSYEVWDPNTVRYVKTSGMPSTISGKGRGAAHAAGVRPRRAVGVRRQRRLGRPHRRSAQRQPIDVYFREKIFGPLGMKDSGFVTAPEQRARQASVHQRQADGSLVRSRWRRRSRRSSTPAAAASTRRARLPRVPPDAPARRQLQRRAHSEARDGGADHQNAIGEIPAGILKTQNPGRSNDVDLFPGAPIRWSLATCSTSSRGRTAQRRHGQLGRDLQHYYWLDPAKRVTGQIMTQILPFADHAC